MCSITIAGPGVLRFNQARGLPLCYRNWSVEEQTGCQGSNRASRPSPWIAVGRAAVPTRLPTRVLTLATFQSFLAEAGKLARPARSRLYGAEWPHGSTCDALDASCAFTDSASRCRASYRADTSWRARHCDVGSAFESPAFTASLTRLMRRDTHLVMPP